MKKPHEAILVVRKANPRGGRNLVASDGIVAMVRSKGGPEWARLFAAAPKMARALLGLLRHHAIVTTREEAEAVTMAQDSLREAGVLEDS